VQHAIAAENRLPCIRAHQVADPQRNDYELIEELLSFSCMEREMVSEWIAEQKRQDHYSCGNPHGTEQGLQVNADAKQLAVIIQSPGVDDRLPRRDRPEAIEEDNGVGDQQENRNP